MVPGSSTPAPGLPAGRDRSGGRVGEGERGGFLGDQDRSPGSDELHGGVVDRARAGLLRAGSLVGPVDQPAQLTDLVLPAGVGLEDVEDRAAQGARCPPGRGLCRLARCLRGGRCGRVLPQQGSPVVLSAAVPAEGRSGVVGSASASFAADAAPMAGPVPLVASGTSGSAVERALSSPCSVSVSSASAAASAAASASPGAGDADSWGASGCPPAGTSTAGRSSSSLSVSLPSALPVVAGRPVFCGGTGCVGVAGGGLRCGLAVSALFGMRAASVGQPPQGGSGVASGGLGQSRDCRVRSFGVVVE